MNILLLRPPRRDPWDLGLSVAPMGLAYIGASLLRAGYRVQIMDAYALGWTWQQLHQWIQRQHFDVLGLTAMTPTLDLVQKSVRLYRPYFRHIIVGGPHPTAVKEKIFEDLPAIDAAVVGEGEEVVLELMRYLSRKGDVPKGVLIPDHPFLPAPAPDIDQLPLPARHLLPNHKYRYLFSTHPRIGTMITSRGCPFRCSFCDKSVSGSRWRARSAKDVVDELEHMQTHFGIGFVNFYDDNFTLHRARVEAICEEILRRGLRMDWKCEGRVDGVDVELLMLMKKAGCRVVAYGVESGNPQSLALLRKDVSIEKSREAFAMTKKAGLRSLAYMILGVPGETPSDVRNSIAFCRELQ
ncbi:MAG: radical SAM protein, partial [Myxococcota bacterium]|nr:radical SAM protein [Myxococcota bacterium]